MLFFCSNRYVVGISCVNIDKQYIYIQIYTYIHKYIHTYIHIYIHTYIHTCIHKYTHTYTYTNTIVCASVCVSPYVCVFLCVYVPMNGLAMWELACPPNRTNWINHLYIDRDSLHSRWSWCCMLITFCPHTDDVNICQWCFVSKVVGDVVFQKS